MPTYEYQCHLCQHQFDAFQKITEDALTMCPKCNQPGLSKLISAVDFQLKGGGWYASGYANNANANPAAGKDSAKPSPTTDKPKSDSPKSE